MRKLPVTAWLAAALIQPCVAQTDALERDMNTVWESIWHQSGTPTRVVRWEQDILVRVHGVRPWAHSRPALNAMREAAAEAGVKVIDVSDRADAAQIANLHIEVTPDDALDNEEPCVTVLNLGGGNTISSATVRMRDFHVWRCVHHEAMHVMGVRGHAAGDTVLNYFENNSSGLLPLDKVMLRAWYSPRTRSGMTPFEVLPVLTNELVLASPDREPARQVEDRFLAAVVVQMGAFVEGTGDVPMIIKRTGKLTDEGVRVGRMEMSLFLGMAYLEGAMVRQDRDQALGWLQRAAAMGSLPAKARLATAGPGP
jgi:hypothetical protein